MMSLSCHLALDVQINVQSPDDGDTSLLDVIFFFFLCYPSLPIFSFVLFWMHIIIDRSFVRFLLAFLLYVYFVLLNHFLQNCQGSVFKAL